jgi:nucleoside-diphosphate-sugar epimerase
MRILITGATGFLGKQVLSGLLSRMETTKIFVVTRQSKTHPNPKVRIIKGDISDPSFWLQEHAQVDHIVHLAANYDFRSTMDQNYVQNVLPVLHLIEAVRKIPAGRRPLIHYASTYAVGHGRSEALNEEPLTKIPSPRQPYPFTKAVAEKALTDSKLASRIFRLGVLVGDSEQGAIEKIDGPYYILQLAWRLHKSSLSKLLTRLPLPVNPEGVIPLVPVNLAAEVFVKSVYDLPRPEGEKAEIYSVFNPDSVTLSELAEDFIAEFLPETKPVLKPELWKTSVLNLQSHITGIPGSALEFGLNPLPLANEKFQAVFGSGFIPHYSTYRGPLLKGFRMYTEGIKI